MAAFKSQGSFQVERAMAIRGERVTVTLPRWLMRQSEVGSNIGQAPPSRPRRQRPQKRKEKAPEGCEI